jgi:DNA polymerase III alpha subunit
MIPIFKSCFSIGKSILTLDEESVEDGADSIIEICQQNNIKDLVLVEDSMTGFMKAFNSASKAGLNLIFGLRINCCNCIKEENETSNHKIIIFAKNDNGCKLLNRIFSFASIEGGNRIDFDYLNSIWCDDLDLAIPFYDSFIFNNNMQMSNCVPNFQKIYPCFFVEKNGLPFDNIIEASVRSFCGDRYPIQIVKSIYYKNKKDFEALQTYKILCNRNFGKASCLTSPNLNHFGSNEFCVESYLRHERRTA